MNLERFEPRPIATSELTLFEMSALQKVATTYNHLLYQFLQDHNLSNLYEGPVDHLALKALDTPDYESYLNLIKPSCRERSYIEKGGRRLATAQLKIPISFGWLGKTAHLEIMEPKAGESGGFFDHIELFRNNLSTVTRVLNHADITYNLSSDPSHPTLVVKLSPNGPEVKFTNRRLFDIVKKELSQGLAKTLG